VLCQQCNFKNPEDAIFCGMCGVKILQVVNAENKTEKNKDLSHLGQKLGQKKRHDLAKQLIIQQKQ
jgi:ribosomal protein L40E